MIRANIVALSFALVAVASTTSAHAFPHFTAGHRHPEAQQDSRINVRVYNTSMSFRDVKIDGHVYTVMPHETMLVKAPVGTAVVTETTGNMHHKGDVLFAVTPEMKDKTISIN